MRVKFIMAAAVLTASLIFAGCDPIDVGGKQPETAAAAAAAPDTAAIAAARAQRKFVPPPDSAINDRQFSTWTECSSLLDSLTYFYADSFKTADAVQMLRLQDDFMRAKDRLCRRAGLLGGFDEYRWVAQSLGNPKNKKFLSEDASD